MLAAAQAAGVRRYLRQSVAFWAVPGPGLADEETPLAFDASPAVAADARVVTELEHRLLGNPNIEGIALRYGFFYGPGTWFNPDGDVAQQVRQQQFPIVGNGEGVWSWLHIEDAAIATVAAAEQGNPGIYLIANDQPLAVREWLPAFAQWLNAPPPPQISVEDALKASGADAVYYGTQMRGVSNAKAKRELNFQPRPLEWIVDLRREELTWQLQFWSPARRAASAAVGRTVTELLLKQGKAVRAMVRNEDERAQALRDMGAEVVVGDLLDLDSMHRAIAGCETMYFGMSVSDAYLAATVNAAAVAKHHGVKAFINMSQMTLAQMSITETTPSPQHKLHWLAEQALNWSGLPVVHVRPTVFMEDFFLLFTADSVRESDQIRLPLGEGKTSPVAVEDVARVLATLLANPQPHIGKIYPVFK